MVQLKGGQGSNKITDHCSFNSAMVQLKVSIQKLVDAIQAGFNSAMVQLKDRTGRSKQG